MISSEFRKAEKIANAAVQRVALVWRGWSHKPATRRCLKCRASFESVGVHNRLCARCRPKAAGLFENVEYPTGNWSDGDSEAALREGED